MSKKSITIIAIIVLVCVFLYIKFVPTIIDGVKKRMQSPGELTLNDAKRIVRNFEAPPKLPVIPSPPVPRVPVYKLPKVESEMTKSIVPKRPEFPKPNVSVIKRPSELKKIKSQTE
ncbi:MAG: hypothetical protein ABIH89_03930 [Elusimicrobiota bacterium]